MLGAGAITLGYAWRIEPHWVEIVHRPLPIANLPVELVGKTLVQISDLHIGPVVDDDYLIGVLRRVAELSPDILVITGDFMSCQGNEEIEHVRSILTNLQPGKLATLAILGNHDYAHRWDDVATADKLTTQLTALGIDVLRNRTARVGTLAITGLDDLWSPNFDPFVLREIDPADANLVLCHNPDAADKPIWTGYEGWILSGHTHGGQCKPPFLNPPLIPVMNPRYTAGEIDLFDGRRIYINRGLGYLRRVRFNARPEITAFTLAIA